jgi:sporulation protein YlmC with PRC-barrel domain
MPLTTSFSVGRNALVRIDQGREVGTIRDIYLDDREKEVFLSDL